MTEELYTEYKNQMNSVVGTLVDLSLGLLKNSGNFLPHGALVASDGEIRLVSAAPDGGDLTTSEEVLPVLRDGLRAHVAEGVAEAVATAENVQFAPKGGALRDAVKILYENADGLTVAFYTPFRKRLFGGYVSEEAVAVAASPEIIKNWT